MSEKPDVSETVWGQEETPVTELTITEFEDLCAEAFRVKAEITSVKLVLSLSEQALKKIQSSIMSYLEALGKDSYKSKAGNVYLSKRLSVKVPKEPQAREEFFSYLKEKGIFEDLITVNSQTLNAFYKEEFEAAITNGATDFKLPGIGEPTYFETLNMRKG